LKLQDSDWRANLVKDFFKINFPPMRALKIITGHVSYNPAYTYKIPTENHQSANALQHHLKANHQNIFIQNELLKKEELPKTFKCVPCGKFFTPRKEELVEHIKNQHQN
jgi:hypothetical protein